MNRLLLSFFAAWLAVIPAIGGRYADYGLRFAESEMTRFPELWQYDHGTRLYFGYTQGVGGCTMLRLWKETGDERYYRYVETWADSLVADDGTIHLYSREAYNLDLINAGKVLFDIRKATGDKKYRLAMDGLVEQLKNQPRTCDGGFWHKLIYPHQMWLDGIYMASPFMARYGAEFNKPEWTDEAVCQITLCYQHTHDPATGLLHHAWDESRNQRWADPVTGLSPNFWGRSMGWFFMAMVDCLDYIPQDHEGYQRIVGYVRQLASVLPRYRDADGLWYQVLDCPGREGNYAEASVTAQFMYAYAKAINKGYLPIDVYADIPRDAFEGLTRRLIRVEPDGILSLTQCCAVSGLGGNPYRDGSYEYYIHEKIRDNDGKATGPFIMGCMELEILQTTLDAQANNPRQDDSHFSTSASGLFLFAQARTSEDAEDTTVRQ